MNSIARSVVMYLLKVVFKGHMFGSGVFPDDGLFLQEDYLERKRRSRSQANAGVVSQTVSFINLYLRNSYFVD